MAKSTKKINLSEHTLDIDPQKCDIEKFDFSEIQDYVRELAGSRDYQYEAIRNILIYLWGGKYKNLYELAEKSWDKKESIQLIYPEKDAFLANLPLPERLSGVCHMATGTGKSYVIFAVAYLSIILGKVKRVLVLGPSSTIIESGLKEKFNEYTTGARGMALNALLPSKYRNISVSIQSANQAVEDNTIVVENINAIYDKDRNSIGDKFFDSGEVLVLGDEIHHAYSHLKYDPVGHLLSVEDKVARDEQSERLWMKFLKDEKRIIRHIGFTGTPYNADTYFTDVIFNYSIKDATEDKIIKLIDPIIHTESDEGDTEITKAQRYELIIQKHLENHAKFSYGGKVKPITIFINNNQTSANNNAEEFARELAKYLRIDLPNLAQSELEDIARKKIIVPISKNVKSEYQEALEQIEETDKNKPGGLVEYIFAVNKLSEGWDVDNVFQIVPMEEKLFNSKLLVSQVLGRGLRMPRNPLISIADMRAKYPVVTVQNHEKFASEIKDLVDQVTQCESRFYSSVLPEDKIRSKYNFNLFNLEYIPQSRKENDSSPSKAVSRKLELTPFKDVLDYNIVFDRAGSQNFALHKDFFTIDQVASDIESRFRNWTFENEKFDFGNGQIIDRLPDREDIKKIIKREMDKESMIGTKLSQKNREEINLFFNSFLPRGKKKVVRESVQGKVVPLSTDTMSGSSIRVGSIDDHNSVFMSDEFEDEVGAQNMALYKELEIKFAKQMKLGESGQIGLGQETSFIDTSLLKQPIPNKNLFIVNSSAFKTPQNLVISSHNPEKKFVLELLQHSKYYAAWAKSKDVSFYGIDFEYFKNGKDRVKKTFNPDFFIKIKLDDYLDKLDGDVPIQNVNKLKELQSEGIEEIIVVVEIKSDEDQDPVTKAKESAGKTHFKYLNKRLSEATPANFDEKYRDSLKQYYSFFLIRPELDYADWFADLRNGRVI